MESNRETFSISIVGSKGSGKTSLMQRICDDQFIESHERKQYAICKTKTLELGQGSVDLEIWDICGEFEQGNVDGFVMTIDLSDFKNSYHLASQHIKDYQNFKNAKFIIALTKSDLPHEPAVISSLIDEIKKS